MAEKLELDAGHEKFEGAQIELQILKGRPALLEVSWMI